MQATTTAQGQIQVNGSRDFPVDGTDKVVCVYRKSATCYRVTVIERNEHGMPQAIACYTQEYDHLNGGLPVGLTGREAAWEYMQGLLADMTAAAERPAEVVARTTADTEITTPARSKLTPAKIAAIVSADSDGIIKVDGRAAERTARSLANVDHLGTLIRTPVGARQVVTGLKLNRDGRRLHAALTHNLDLAA